MRTCKSSRNTEKKPNSSNSTVVSFFRAMIRERTLCRDAVRNIALLSARAAVWITPVSACCRMESLLRLVCGKANAVIHIELSKGRIHGAQVQQKEIGRQKEIGQQKIQSWREQGRRKRDAETQARNAAQRS